MSLMNKKAASLGMEATIVTDPSGVEGSNVSTVHDLFALTRYIFHNRSFVWGISAGKVSDATYGPTPFLGLTNLNIGVHDPSFRGGKVGKSTTAQETAIAIFDVTHQGTSRPLVFIVLGSDNAERDIKILREHVGTVYEAW
jgi:D-alanyl-D-alanine carboxypeptidase